MQSNGGKRKRSTTPEWEAAAGGHLRAAGGVSCGEAARLYSDFTAEDLAGTNCDQVTTKCQYHRLNMEVDLQSLFGLHVT